MYQYKKYFIMVKYIYVTICNIIIKWICVFLKPDLVSCHKKAQNGVFDHSWLKIWGISTTRF